MVLSRNDIRHRCIHTGLLSPFSEEGKAFGLTYGLSICGYDVRLDQDIYLKVNGFELASTIEYFKMPNDLVAIVHDKSTWARQGLTVQNTVAEPGWEGWLTLELTNHGISPLILKKGMPIAQVLFHILSEPVEIGYKGKYQNQARGPQPSIFEED